MARTTLAINDIVMGGLFVGSGTGEVAADVANGNDFVNDGNVFLHVRNTDSVTRWLSLKCPLTFDGNPVSDYAANIAAGGEELIGPFPLSVFQQSNGRVNFDGTSALLAIKAYRIPVAG